VRLKEGTEHEMMELMRGRWKEAVGAVVPQLEKLVLLHE